MRRKQARVSAQYWIDVAAKALSKRGPDALTIDAMCRATGKTKGSFYAHFDNHDAFLAALAAYWRENATEAVIRSVDSAASNRRLSLLNTLAVRVDSRLDQGMRSLAGVSQLVAEAVADVDKTRTAYLAGLYRAAGGYSDSEARDLAAIEYAAYVGLQQIKPKRGPRELERLYAAFTKLISRSA